jgi:hypothetical protein
VLPLPRDDDSVADGLLTQLIRLHISLALAG